MTAATTIATLVRKQSTKVHDRRRHHAIALFPSQGNQLFVTKPVRPWPGEGRKVNKRCGMAVQDRTSLAAMPAAGAIPAVNHSSQHILQNNPSFGSRLTIVIQFRGLFV